MNPLMIKPAAVAFNHVPRKVGTLVQTRIDALKIGQKMQDLPEALWHDSFRFYVKEDPTRVGGPNLRMIRLDPAKPSLTVTGFIFNKFVHPYENRFITPREAARLQGFPDHFFFCGSMTSVQTQVGNAVPVPLAHAVAQAVLSHLCKYQPEGIGNTRYACGRFPVLSLFSGAGGLDLGIKAAHEGDLRWEVKAGVEWDEDCCDTLRHNFKHDATMVIPDDITKLNPTDLANHLKLEDGCLPLLIGGPPCQAFSQAGKQKGVDDPRGKMIFQFLRFVRELRPVYFIMENVAGLGTAKQKDLRSDILKEMASYGYSVSHGVLCAADYGAAQLRKRLLFVGVRGSVPTVKLPLPTHGVSRSATAPYFSVGEAFANLPVMGNYNHPNAVAYEEFEPPMENALGIFEHDQEVNYSDPVKKRQPSPPRRKSKKHAAGGLKR